MPIHTENKGRRRRWRVVSDCKSDGYALGGSNPLLPTKILYLLVLKLVGIIVISCGQLEPSTSVQIRDTRTAGYPSDVMYPWLLGGKSKTKKYVKDDIKYIAPVCGQCR